MPSTNIPGLPGGPLVTTYPIRMHRIPPGGRQRTGEPARAPRRSVQHGTANASNASAWNEADYFVRGAEGRGVSVHACVDHTEIVVTMPFDEVAVHAGSTAGNQHGYACEMIEATATWNDPSRRDRMIAIAADFMGRVAARLGVPTPERHSDFGNPGCPAKLQNERIGGRMAWDVYVNLWHEARADELAKMQGTVPADVPDFVAADAARGYPGDHPFEFEDTTAYGCLREWTATKATPRRFTALLDAEKVGPDLQAGEKFAGWDVFKRGGEWWVLTKLGTRVLMDDLDERVRVPQA